MVKTTAILALAATLAATATSGAWAQAQTGNLYGTVVESDGAAASRDPSASAGTTQPRHPGSPAADLQTGDDEDGTRVRKLPGLHKTGDVTLKRGVVD